jgi:KDO2-lipid IV(A) lauroyltransferase
VAGRTSKEYVEYLAFLLFKIPLFILPRSFCLILGEGLGTIVYYLDGKHRKIAFSNLAVAFGPHLSVQEREKKVKASFRHFGRAFIDVLKTRHRRLNSIRRLLVFEGREYLDQALEEGRGALLFSAHYGNWELAPACISQLGRLHVVARSLDNRFLEKELSRIRRGLGAEVIYKRLAVKPILRALKSKAMVAILIDQNVLRDQAVFVDFFGKPAATTPSLATFFLKTKAPIVPVFCYPASKGRYQLKILPPLKIDLSGNDRQDVLKITQLCTKIIQEQIMKNPEYWFWFHNRWKTRPRAEETLDAKR